MNAHRCKKYDNRTRKKSAEQLRRNSMSQEQVEDTLSQNAQQHREARSSLPDDRRSEIRTQNTAQRRRSRSTTATIAPADELTDEELLKVFNPTPEQQERIYKLCDSNIDAALKTFHHNAGAPLSKSAYPEGNMAQEINESKLEFEEVQRVTRAYNEHMNNANFKTCASCRVRNIEDRPERVPVSSLEQLELKSNERATYHALKDDIRDLQHVFHNDQNNKLYYLDPEFVMKNADTGDYEVYLCTKISNCHGNVMRKTGKKRPPVSLAGGYDYGRIPSWTKELSYLDCIIAGMYAPFHGAFKISSILDGKSFKSMKEARGHFIFLAHDGAAKISHVDNDSNVRHQQQLPRTDVSDCMRIVFVGSRDTFDSMTNTDAKKLKFIKSCGSGLVVHPQNIMKLIRLKKAQCDAGYEHVKLPVEHSDDEAALIKKLQQVPFDLLELVEFVDDAKAMRTDAIVTSDIAAPKSEPITAVNSSNPFETVQPNLPSTVNDTATTLVSDSVQFSDRDHSVTFFPHMKDRDENLSKVIPEDSVEDDLYVIPVKATVIGPSVGIRAMNEADLVSAARNIVEQNDGQQLARAPHPINVFNNAANEFENNGLLLMTLFPALFLRSAALKWDRGPLTTVEQKHMLLQVDGRFCNNSLFLYVLHDQKQRHAASLHSNITINSTNNAYTTEFMELINKDNAVEQLDRAQRDINAPESKALINLLSKVINATGQHVAWSKQERLAFRSDLYAMMVYYGAPSCFFTVSFADMDSMLFLRLCFVFPGDDHEEFMNIPLPTVKERINLTSQSPFHAAVAFKYTYEAILEHLFQIKPDYKIKVARGPITLLMKALLGVVRAFASVVEFQARGSAHSHGLFFCSASPDNVRHAISDTVQMKKLSEQLDSLVCASLPMDVLDSKSELNQKPVLSSYKCKEDTPLHRDHRHDANLASEADMTEKAHRIGRQLQMHLHRPTCHKGKRGLQHCREGYGKALCDEGTRYVEVCFETTSTGERQLRLLKQPTKKDRSGYDVIMDNHADEVFILEISRPSWNAMSASSDTHEHSETKCTAACSDYVIDPVDEVGHKRYSNANVACFSPALLATLGCNHNVEFLGNRAQCIGACHYIVKYMIKDGNEPVSILAMAQQAVINAKKYPSTAVDEVIDERKRHSKLVLTKVLNKYSGMTEVSGELAALHLLDFPSNQVSTAFTYAFTKPALAHVRSMHKQHPPEISLDHANDEANANVTLHYDDILEAVYADDNQNIHKSRNTSHDDTHMEEEEVDIMYEDDENAEQDRFYWDTEGDGDPNPNAAKTISMRIVSGNDQEGGRHGLTDQLSCYIHRGAELKNVNYQEYVSIIANEKKPSNIATVRRPRRRSTSNEAEDVTTDHQGVVEGLISITCQFFYNDIF